MSSTTFGMPASPSSLSGSVSSDRSAGTYSSRTAPLPPVPAPSAAAMLMDSSESRRRCLPAVDMWPSNEVKRGKFCAKGDTSAEGKVR